MKSELKILFKILTFVALVALLIFLLYRSWSARYSLTVVQERNIVSPDNADTHILIGGGEFDGCGNTNGKFITAMLRHNDGTIFTTGDNIENGAKLSDYIKCFGSVIGDYKQYVKPSLGREDYKENNAAGYFSYFGNSSGPAGKGYYSYDLGYWHIVVLNSNCDQVGGCDKNSEQGMWLKRDLSENKLPCTLAYWYLPLFNSGKTGGDNTVKDFWRILYEYKTDIVLNGQERGYERFAMQDPGGSKDEKLGIREFIVGTAGAGHSDVDTIVRNSEVRNYDTFGLLKLSLSKGNYNWEFLPEPGKKFSDSGSSICH